jgi:threonine dehydratase
MPFGMSDFPASARSATLALRELFAETPLQRNDHLSARYGAEIWLKREDLTPVRSYKLRGAFNAMRKVRAQDPGQGHFVCASAGNHAQGVAYACRHFGVRGTIFMPVTTPQQKIDKTRMFGGDNVTIQLTGDYFDQTLAAAQEFCRAEGGAFPGALRRRRRDRGSGQRGGRDRSRSWAARRIWWCCRWAGGAGVWRVDLSARGRARGAVPLCRTGLGGASLKAALEAGRAGQVAAINSFVDGAAVARVGDLTFRKLDWVDRNHVLLAPEDRICITMLEMLNVEGIVLEPAGALSVDVLPELAPVIRGKTVVCVTSGGNFDFERLPEVKERAQRYAGLKKYFILRMPQRPGALREFLSMLGPEDDITRFEYLKKSARNFGSVLIGIETKRAENFARFTGRHGCRGICLSATSPMTRRWPNS